MKTQFHIILLCLAGLTFNIGCEKATLQNEESNQSSLKNRGDCDACPENDECCCAVWLQAIDNSASLQICGNTSGFSTCSKPGTTGCSAFTGITYSFTITGSDVQEFCALISGPFWIKNTHGSDNASIVISCRLMRQVLKPFKLPWAQAMKGILRMMDLVQ